MKILVGISGGVDSCAAAALLNDKYDVGGITLKLYCGDGVTAAATDKNISDARAVCEKIGIEHNVLDLQNDFKKYVTDRFVSSYLEGETPNPCLDCNKYIKFGKMLDFAQKNGYDKIATGHYATVEEKDGKFYLKCALDRKKDQTYVLYALSQDILSRLILPLGQYTKDECRAVAESRGLITAHKSDSQDICFVPDGDYPSFIENAAGAQKSGDYLDINGTVLGKHRGVIHYTVGQRKGLGIALGHPVFVLNKDAQNNTVTLGEEEGLFYNGVLLRDVTFICDEIKSGDKITAKLRYSQNADECIFIKTDGGVKLVFTKPQRAPTPGQAAVFYKGDYCLGGGIIVKGISV